MRPVEKWTHGVRDIVQKHALERISPFLCTDVANPDDGEGFAAYR